MHAPSNRFRTRGLGAAAAGLAAVSTSKSAFASIIYDLNVNATTGQTISIDGTAAGELELTSAGMMNLDLYLEAPAGMGMDPGSTVELSVFSSGGMMAVDYLVLMDPGDTVDGSLVFASEGYLVEQADVNPDWAPGTTGYAGFVFDPNGTGPLYGWMQVEFDSSGTDFTVLQWGYDDSGAPIAAGAIPEPSTSLLLAVGLIGLAGRRRRRKRMSLADAKT